MKIVASVGLKDEVELIGPVISHLRAIGADHIFVSDGGSTDGSLEYLDSISGDADIALLPYDDSKPGLDERANGMVFDAARAAGADWLILLDADEFLLPAGGSLKESVARAGDADVIQIARFNTVLLPDGLALPLPPVPARYDEILFYAPDSGHKIARENVRADADLPWIRLVQPDKVIIRPDRVTGAAAGGHAAKGADLTEVRAPDLLIAHVPFSTEARFARKLRNIERIYAATGKRWGKDSAWHWRRWLDNVASHGGVAGEIARNTITPALCEELQADGMIKSAAALLARGRL